MAKPRDSATAQDVLDTIALWATKRAELADGGLLPPTHPEHVVEMSRVLEENAAYIHGALAKLISANTYSNRLWLSDVSPELKEFFNREKVYTNREMVDFLRSWFKSFFGDRVRVEGDNNMAGLYLDIA